MKKEYLSMALHMCQLDVTDLQADLIIRVYEALMKKGGSMTIMDAKKILHQWKQDHNLSENHNKGMRFLKESDKGERYNLTKPQCCFCSYLVESGQTDKCCKCRRIDLEIEDIQKNETGWLCLKI